MWRFCNDDKRLIPIRPIRNAVSITKGDFAKKLIDHVNKISNGKKNLKYPDDLDKLCYSVIQYLFYFDKGFAKDLDISFDAENADGRFETLDNGLTCIKAWAGGDWEEPVSFVIYYDGERPRGYVPKFGNVINNITKTAFGSESDSDHFEDFIREMEEFLDKNPKYKEEILDESDDVILLDMELEKVICLYNLIYGDNPDASDEYDDEDTIDLEIKRAIKIS